MRVDRLLNEAVVAHVAPVPGGPPDLVEACDRYLAGLHTVLWGQAFDAHHPVGRRQAAEWLARQIEGVQLMTEQENR